MTTQTGNDHLSPTKVQFSPGPGELNPRREARKKRRQRMALGILTPVTVLVLWEVSARIGIIDARFFGQPSGVIQRLFDDLFNGTLVEAAWITSVRLLIGYSTGTIVGIIVGLALSQYWLLRAAFEPILRALYVIPKLAILPLLLLVFGLGEMPKYVFVGLGTFYIVAFSTLTGALMISPAYHEVAQAYGFSRRQRFRWVVLPASLPHIVSAMRLASGYAMLLVIAVEFLQSDSGLGYYTWHAWELFIAERMYVGMIVIAILGVLFSSLVRMAGARLVHWAEEEFQTSL